jgi:hypothetical protein
MNPVMDQPPHTLCVVDIKQLFLDLSWDAAIAGRRPIIEGDHLHIANGFAQSQYTQIRKLLLNVEVVMTSLNALFFIARA